MNDTDVCKWICLNGRWQWGYSDMFYKEPPLYPEGLDEAFPDMSEDEILMILDEEEGELG